MIISPNAPKLFNYFNYYRCIVSLLLVGMTFTQKDYLSRFRDAELFQSLAFGYLALCIFSLLAFQFYLKVRPKQIFAWFVVDILFLHALLYCGPGLSGTGLDNLVIISVAAGNIVISGLIGLSFAAVASIATLVVVLDRTFADLAASSDLPSAGLQGAIYFASAFILQNLSSRILQSELIAEAREKDLEELQRLNHQVIESMRTGIIVCSPEGLIRTRNQACLDLLGMAKEARLIPPQLSDRIQLWERNPNARTTPFRTGPDKPLVQANFSKLKKGRGDEILIFLEDTRLMTQQAQQMKLASLGRLTASIAHEVRNPLGAISHATQLLAESENLDAADRKMTDIIQRHSLRVNRIIENTLQISRRAEPKTEEVLLAPWLEQLIAEYQEQRSAPAPIVLDIKNPEVSARFDPSQISQVLTNLIDNGLKHGQALSQNASLEIRLAQTPDQSQAYIEVIDQGPGISPDNQTHLFEPFFTTNPQGTGLGLYLSREICEANQAQLDYIETNEPGACFRVMFAHHKRIV